MSATRKKRSQRQSNKNIQKTPEKTSHSNVSSIEATPPKRILSPIAISPSSSYTTQKSDKLLP